MAIWVLTNLDENLGRPIQVLLLLFRVPAAMPGKVNEVRSHLNANVQRSTLDISTQRGIGSRHGCTPSATR
jgi:hypothetical protein